MSRGWRDAGGNSATWKRVRAYVLARDNYRCRINGPKCMGVATHADHILGVKYGHDPQFIRASCANCNLSRNSIDETKFEIKKITKW